MAVNGYTVERLLTLGAQFYGDGGSSANKVDTETASICVIGLGYAGPPLAVEFGQQDKTRGYDLPRASRFCNSDPVPTSEANSSAQYRNFRSADGWRLLASIEKANRLLGYCPTYATDAGTREAMPWY